MDNFIKEKRVFPIDWGEEKSGQRFTLDEKKKRGEKDMPGKNKGGGKRGGVKPEKQIDKSIKVATSAATANAHYDPETDTVTLNKGQDEVTITPCNPANEKQLPAEDFALKLAGIRIEKAAVGINTEGEAIQRLRRDIDTVDAVWICKTYVGQVSPLSKMQRADGSYCYTGTPTFLRETDGVSDVSLRLIDSRTKEPVSRREYAWVLRLNGHVFEQRARILEQSPRELVGEWEAAPCARFPTVIPFKVIPAASAVQIDYILEESLVQRAFPHLSWEVSYRGYVFGNPPARFAASVQTWAYLKTVVDERDCVFEMRGGTAAFHVGTWEQVCQKRAAAEEEQKKKQQEESEQRQREQPGSAQAELDRMFK